MGGRVGGLTSKYYKETRGLKVSGGQAVKAGTVLTRQGHRWHPGINIIGRTHLTAACDGEIYFTRKKSKFNRVLTLINIRPVSQTAPKPAAKPKAKAAGKPKSKAKTESSE